ncbi:MAG: hypothetical protein WAV31_03250 [Candidatus Moraniibacteriota bacterium]
MAFNFFELSDEYMRVMQKDKQRKRTLYSRRIIISAADDDYTLSGKKLVSVMAELRLKKLPATQNKIWDTLRMYKKTKLAFQGDCDTRIYLSNLIPSKHWLAIASECLLKDGFKTWDQIEEAGSANGVYEKKSIDWKKVDGSVKPKDVTLYSVLDKIREFISDGLYGNAVKLMKGIIEDYGRDKASLINCLDELGQANIYAKANEDLRAALLRKDEEIKAANKATELCRQNLAEVSDALNNAKKKIKELEGYIGGLKRQLGDLRKTKPKKKVRKKKKPA